MWMGLIVQVQRILRSLSMIYWKAPPIGYYKLNTDGVSRGNPGQIVGGGAIRDLGGNLVATFSSFYEGIHTNLYAKLMAALEGLQLWAGLHIYRLKLEMDSMSFKPHNKKIQNTLEARQVFTANPNGVT
ncbi:hypothetical protein ACH5RR_012649 [Cinchona calisaya]|uniref:RNase H type-1 domain-containing protein n=1 Tax=Cinchona calisaya TaxID=153742 RepID=A0ABD3A9Z0_9GENT